MNEVQVYHPEMNQAEPEAQIEMRLSHYGNTRLLTRLELPKLRGLKYVETWTAETLIPQAQHKAGTRIYTATSKAVETLRQSFTFKIAVML